MKLATRNFLKKVITVHIPKDVRYQKIFNTLLSDKRKISGHIVYTSLNRFYKHMGVPIITDQMNYQEVFNLLEKKGIIKKENYNYVVDEECRLYLEGKQPTHAVRKKDGHPKLSVQKKNEIKFTLVEELRTVEFERRVNRYSDSAFRELLSHEIDALIDCYENNKSISQVWGKYEQALGKMYRGKKKADDKIRPTGNGSRTFRRHLERYDKILIQEKIIALSDSIIRRKDKSVIDQIGSNKKAVS